ncbi:MAG: PLP-dependent aminotransferase family protein [Xanthomonadales bacterium]
MVPRPANVTFDAVPPRDVIHFGIGQPAPDLMPVEVLRAATADFLARAKDHPLDLNYGERQGDAGFRAALADFLTHNYGHPATPDELFVTGGNSQALDFVCAQFTRPGDTVFIEEPTYFLAHRIFDDHGLNVVGIPMDADGMRMDVFRERLAHGRPALVYTIPSFHNPCSVTLSGARRRELAALSREHDFVVAADEVYQLLYCDEPPPPAMGTMLDEGNILSLGTFSKIMAPALRLGWIQGSPALVERILQSGFVNSGGSINHFTSEIMRHALELGLQQETLERLRPAYRSRLEAMDAALHAGLGDHAQWTRPDGGYFFWLELDHAIDTLALKDQALAAGTGFQPGSVFSCGDGFSHFIRLSFAHYSEQEIAIGIERLAGLLK